MTHPQGASVPRCKITGEQHCVCTSCLKYASLSTPNPSPLVPREAEPMEGRAAFEKFLKQWPDADRSDRMIAWAAWLNAIEWASSPKGEAPPIQGEATIPGDVCHYCKQPDAWYSHKVGGKEFYAHKGCLPHGERSESDKSLPEDPIMHTKPGFPIHDSTLNLGNSAGTGSIPTLPSVPEPSSAEGSKCNFFGCGHQVHNCHPQCPEFFHREPPESNGEGDGSHYYALWHESMAREDKANEEIDTLQAKLSRLEGVVKEAIFDLERQGSGFMDIIAQELREGLEGRGESQGDGV